MRIIISPAKKMKTDPDSLAPQGLPQLLPRTRRLLSALRAMSDRELQTLWACSDAIAQVNIRRVRTMDLDRALTPALLSYVGIQYQYMAPSVFETRQFAYLQERLRVLSGFYGLLRPFDAVTPYRLEMQARLRVDGCRDLYQFWGDALAASLAAETGLVVNLASQEYSRAVAPHLPASVRLLTCTFGQEQKGKVVEKGTLCKMARGQMVRWMAENAVDSPAQLRDFHDLGYVYRPDLSQENHYIYTKE